MPHRPLRAAARIAAAGLALLVWCPAWTASAVYRCAGEHGVPGFSQFPCGTQPAVPLPALPTVRMPPISAAERRVLDDLALRQRQARRQRAEARRRADRQAARRREQRADACRAAREALAALARQRRKGYSLQQARALERREAELEAERRAAC